MSSDRDAIIAVINEAAWIFDHRQWERMDEVFTDDAEAYGQSGLDAITSNTLRYLGDCGPTQHLIGNHRVTVDGDKASSTSYIRAFHHAKPGRPAQYWDFVGEYRDEWQRTAAGWRITRRRCIPLATLGDLDLLAGHEQ